MVKFTAEPQLPFVVVQETEKALRGTLEQFVTVLLLARTESVQVRDVLPPEVLQETVEVAAAVPLSGSDEVMESVLGEAEKLPILV